MGVKRKRFTFYIFFIFSRSVKSRGSVEFWLQPETSAWMKKFSERNRLLLGRGLVLTMCVYPATKEYLVVTGEILINTITNFQVVQSKNTVKIIVY